MNSIYTSHFIDVTIITIVLLVNVAKNIRLLLKEKNVNTTQTEQTYYNMISITLSDSFCFCRKSYHQCPVAIYL